MKNKGHQLKSWDRYDVVLTGIGLIIAFLAPVILLYGKSFFGLPQSAQLKNGMLIGLVILLVVIGSLLLLYRFVPYFQNKRDIRLVFRYLLDRQFIERVSLKNGQGEKLKIPRVYVKKTNRATIAVTFEMVGKVLHELDKIPSDLEKIFFADFKERNDFRESGLFAKHSFSQFVFSDDKENQRLPIEQIAYDTKRGIRLMDGEFWDFVHAPHLLIAGGTGGGKTIFLLCLLKVLATFAMVEICDPKKSDLSVLDAFEVFQGHVHSELDDIISCLETAVDFMENRYRQMGLNSENPEAVKIGNNYQSYGLAPKFVVVDEWTAFVASLDIRKSSHVDDLMAQLILKGRQAGIFLIVAMQRPDAEYLSANLRDNMIARISLGRLSKTGYRMIFGEEYEDKNYLFIKSKIGRGYATLDGEMPSEFFSPLIPFETGFSFEEIFAKMKPLKSVEGKLKVEEQPTGQDEEEEEETYTASSLAKALKLSATTVTRLLGYLSESSYEFAEEDGCYITLDKDILEEVVTYKRAHERLSWKEATQNVIAEWCQ